MLDIAIMGDTQWQKNSVILYKFHSCYLDLDMVSKNDTGECGIVHINDNQTTFSSMECRNNATILCSGEWIFFLEMNYKILIEKPRYHELFMHNQDIYRILQQVSPAK